MTIPNNILQQVQTYQKAQLGKMDNSNCFVGKLTNKRFKSFPGINYNLGSSVTFDLPPLFTSSSGLVASWQPAVQQVQTLTCDQANNVSYAFTAQNKVFNVDKDTDSYMAEFGSCATTTLGSKVEINVALNLISAVPVMTVNSQGQSVPTGALHTDSGPFSFYGDGVTNINSYQQFAQWVANFKETGMVGTGIKCVFPEVLQPQIIGTGLNQFAPKRNDADANSWEIGNFGGVEYFTSNLLPVHVAGTIGDTAAPNNLMTVVSTNDATGANISQITFTEPTGGTDANAVKAGDLFQFMDGISGQANIRRLTLIGNHPTSQPVQFRALADAATVAGTVTVSVAPLYGTGTYLQSAAGATQNISRNIVAGMKVKPLPSHRAGGLIGGGAFYLAMPQLPDQYPFPTGNSVDPETGASIRLTSGATIGQNQYGSVLDEVHGSTLVPIYSMRGIFVL